MNRKLSPASSTGAATWAAVLLCAALALSGCGRKGPLELPPTASSPTAANANAAAPPDSEQEAAGRPSVFNPNYGSDAPPAAPKVSRRPFVLDPLLGN